MKYDFPVDHECKLVQEFNEMLMSDPMTAMVPGDVIGEVIEAWEAKHRARCSQCREHGCANVGVK